ncbi:MAG: MmcQ/YjbR family DNA-binding protein [Phocaeicola sp.]
MNIEELRDYCLGVKGAVEEMPFGDEYLVYKVCGKMFALIPLDDLEPNITLKCDPDLAIDLREKYSCVTPAFHFNKRYWNNIVTNQQMHDESIKYWINHSVEEVMKKLSKRIREAYYDTSGSD